jgi:hypothetical protein
MWVEFMKNPALYAHLRSPPRPFALDYDVKGINQTVYFSVANADIARILGTTANVTRKIRSNSWPPTDPNIILFNTSRIDPANGLLGAISLRYTKGNSWDRFEGGGMEGVDVYTPGPTYRYFESRERVEEANRAWTVGNPVGYSDYRYQPFGGVHFDALDIDKAKISMTMQLGADTHSFGSSVGTPGLRQIIMVSQLSSALVRLKFKGQYIISQGIRALPFEFQWDRLKNRAATMSATFMFPFALSFLLPGFVTILVQEKEGRHRMMMAMVSSGFFFWACHSFQL